MRRGGEDIERTDLQRSDLAVDHDVNGTSHIEFDMAHGAARSEGVLEVRAIVKLRQSAEQAQAADGSPADKFDQAVGRIGMRRDEHVAAGKFAVVEREKEAAAFVPGCVVVAAKGKGAATQLDDAYEDTEQVAEMAERLERTIRCHAHIGRESRAQYIERIEFASGQGA